MECHVSQKVKDFGLEKKNHDIGISSRGKTYDDSEDKQSDHTHEAVQVAPPPQVQVPGLLPEPSPLVQLLLQRAFIVQPVLKLGHLRPIRRLRREWQERRDKPGGREDKAEEEPEHVCVPAGEGRGLR